MTAALAGLHAFAEGSLAWLDAGGWLAMGVVGFAVGRWAAAGEDGLRAYLVAAGWLAFLNLLVFARRHGAGLP